jgi:FtsH-binding integral membrane protein
MKSYPLESESEPEQISDLTDKVESEDKQEISLDIKNSEEFEKEQEEIIHKKMRLGFIRKVYGILSVQLLITVILCGLSFNESVKTFMIESTGFFWVAMSLSIILAIPLLCFKSIARKVPLNYFILFIWTLSEAYMVACVCSLYDGKVVIMAAIATLVVTGSITLYAFYTKEDFTFLGSFLFSAVSLLILLSIFSFLIPFTYTIVCILGVFIYSLYLLYDTQLILGKVGTEFSVDDYILASICIYVDILQIFLYILEILARLNNN